MMPNKKNRSKKARTHNAVATANIIIKNDSFTSNEFFVVVGGSLALAEIKERDKRRCRLCTAAEIIYTRVSVSSCRFSLFFIVRRRKRQSKSRRKELKNREVRKYTTFVVRGRQPTEIRFRAFALWMDAAAAANVL